MTVFYLGTHQPAWLRRLGVPLFVSHMRMIGSGGKGATRVLPRARTTWALDSGAFSQVAAHGAFTSTALDYVRAVRRYRDEIGRLSWAAPQDHMCEPFVLARSQLASTVPEAQAWTVANLLDLRTLAADLPFVPVLQGQTLDDYRRHVEQYARVGVDLHAEALVGLGSVCRRQATPEIGRIVSALAADGLRLHGFGVKADGLRRYGAQLVSADSMAWSYNGRKVRPCPHRGSASCANCPTFALDWRRRLVDEIGR